MINAEELDEADENDSPAIGLYLCIFDGKRYGSGAILQWRPDENIDPVDNYKPCVGVYLSLALGRHLPYHLDSLQDIELGNPFGTLCSSNNIRALSQGNDGIGKGNTRR